MASRINRFAEQIERLVSSASGVTVTEYAVMVALIVLTAIASIAGIGLAVEGSFIALYEHVASIF